MERRGRRFPRYRARGGYFRESGPRTLRVENITPDTGVVNVRCTTVNAPRLLSDAGERLWEIVVGDETGVMYLHLDERFANIAQCLIPGVSLTLQSCQVKMLNHRFLAVTPGAQGTVDVSPMKLHIQPNVDVNISAYEYKYVID